MTWFWLALGSAFFLATGDYLTKRHFSDLPLGQMILVRLTGLGSGVPGGVGPHPSAAYRPRFLLGRRLGPARRGRGLVPVFAGHPGLSFGLDHAIHGFYAALFVLGTGWLFLGELPNAAGLAGVLLVVAGAYVLNLHHARYGWAAPLLAVAKEKGSLMALAVSALYGYTIALGKVGLAASGPWFMASIYPLGLAVVIVAVLAARRQLGWDWLRRPWPALAVGFCMAAMLVCHFWALTMAPAAYMVAVKRLSIIMVVLYGGVLLKEARLAQHLMASGLMVAGAVVVLIFG